MERTARDILDSPQSLTKISILVMNISVKETLKKSIIWIFFLFKGFFFFLAVIARQFEESIKDHKIYRQVSEPCLTHYYAPKCVTLTPEPRCCF